VEPPLLSKSYCKGRKKNCQLKIAKFDNWHLTPKEKRGNLNILDIVNVLNETNRGAIIDEPGYGL
jgi:hypothetical protein